ncbi:hypothetical protein HHX47_DHR5000436 [Lentinula edodes]|nr:hypothetical protein HHX47_DHR5000436 [Lentinula edodes]
MFSGLHENIMPSDGELANQALHEESNYRFPSFSASDAVTLGLSIRKRFRASSRHSKGKGLVISIQTIAGHTLFSCTVGDLGHSSGIGDVSLDSWTCLEGMISAVRRTGHSSYYVEKGMSAMGKTSKQLGLPGELPRIQGGGESQVTSWRCNRVTESGTTKRFLYGWSAGGDTAGPSMSNPSMPIPNIPPRTESDWLPEPSEFTSRRAETYDRHEVETEFSH